MAKKRKKTEYPGLPAAKRLMDAVNEALENVDEIVACSEHWSEDGDHLEAPPLLKQSACYKEAVDPAILKKFEGLVSFMTDVLFGVDCDNDHAVRFQIVDQGREENFLPDIVIKRLGYKAPIDKQMRQVELVKMIRDSVSERLKRMERCLEEDLKEVITRISIKRRAKDCPLCKGKGWVETDAATWEALDYGERCHTKEIGCNWQKDSTGPYRLFCACQKSEDDDDGEDSE